VPPATLLLLLLLAVVAGAVPRCRALLAAPLLLLLATHRSTYDGGGDTRLWIICIEEYKNNGTSTPCDAAWFCSTSSALSCSKKELW